MPTLLLIAYVYNSTDFLNAQEVYDFIEKIKFDFFHGETGPERIYNSFAAVAGEVYFNTDTETLLGDKNGGKMRVLFHDAKSSKIVVLVKIAGFGKAVFVEPILNLAGRTEVKDQDSNDAKND